MKREVVQHLTLPRARGYTLRQTLLPSLIRVHASPRIIYFFSLFLCQRNVGFCPHDFLFQHSFIYIYLHALFSSVSLHAFVGALKRAHGAVCVSGAGSCRRSLDCWPRRVLVNTVNKIICGLRSLYI